MTHRRRALAGGFLLATLLGPTTAAAAAGRIDVAVALDFGTNGRAPVATCVSVPEGATGAVALAAALDQLKLPRATYAASGLLCSIGGWPNRSDCGRRDADGYHYWSYFHGGASGWRYASNGPAANLASASSAEGWRFQDAGTGRPVDPAPRLSATDRSACAALRSGEDATTTTSPPRPLAPATSTPSSSTTTTSRSSAAAPTTTPSAQASARHLDPPASASRRAEHASGAGAWASVVVGVALVAAALALLLRRRGSRR